MRLAVVDLGTNTCRLLLGEVADGVVVRQDARETEVVRLGQGVDRTGSLDAQAIARTRHRLGVYAERIDRYAPDRRLLVATSVLRDAADGAAFLAAAERDYSLPFRVVDGRDEARLAFRGATAALGSLANSDVAVVDIGGGSTEFAVGRPGGVPSFVRSLDVGAVRITERFFTDDPPSTAQWRAATGFVDDQIHGEIPAAVGSGVRTVVGVAGTFTTLVAHELGLRVYDSAQVDGRRLTLSTIESAIDVFRELTSAERGRLPGIPKGREDVILAGALIAREACRAFASDAVLVREADILEGATLWLADGLPPLA